jgi:hypothetical protein
VDGQQAAYSPHSDCGVGRQSGGGDFAFPTLGRAGTMVPIR